MVCEEGDGLEEKRDDKGTGEHRLGHTVSIRHVEELAGLLSIIGTRNMDEE